MVVMANPDDKGQATLTADTDGEGFVRIDGQYLAQALKACGGMVDFKLTNALSPIPFPRLFSFSSGLALIQHRLSEYVPFSVHDGGYYFPLLHSNNRFMRGYHLGKHLPRPVTVAGMTAFEPESEFPAADLILYRSVR